jgi:metal-dependent amidase/aminoacylase/carboxypeptidase family protein
MMNRGFAERCVSCFWKTLETGLATILANTNRAVSMSMLFVARPGEPGPGSRKRIVRRVLPNSDPGLGLHDSEQIPDMQIAAELGPFLIRWATS